MARPRQVRTTLAAAALAVPLALVVAPSAADAAGSQYTVAKTFSWSGTFGSRMMVCNLGDYAVSHRIAWVKGPAKVRSATFYSERTGNTTHPAALAGIEGAVVEWRDGQNKPGAVSVQLVCKPD